MSRAICQDRWIARWRCRDRSGHDESSVRRNGMRQDRKFRRKVLRSSRFDASSAEWDRCGRSRRRSRMTDSRCSSCLLTSPARETHRARNRRAHAMCNRRGSARQDEGADGQARSKGLHAEEACDGDQRVPAHGPHARVRRCVCERLALAARVTARALQAAPARDTDRECRSAQGTVFTGKEMVARVGIEPTTRGFSVGRRRYGHL
jgi:hypothetical protein